nr:hypothetical protein [Tanacetum cinerariifolium]
APVENPAHAAHSRGYRLAHLKLPARCFGHRAHRLDTQDARKLHARRVALAGKQLRAVQAEGPHPNEYLVGSRHRAGHLPVVQHLGRTRLVKTTWLGGRAAFANLAQKFGRDADVRRYLGVGQALHKLVLDNDPKVEVELGVVPVEAEQVRLFNLEYHRGLDGLDVELAGL